MVYMPRMVLLSAARTKDPAPAGVVVTSIGIALTLAANVYEGAAHGLSADLLERYLRWRWFCRTSR